MNLQCKILSILTLTIIGILQLYGMSNPMADLVEEQCYKNTRTNEYVLSFGRLMVDNTHSSVTIVSSTIYYLYQAPSVTKIYMVVDSSANNTRAYGDKSAQSKYEEFRATHSLERSFQDADLDECSLEEKKVLKATASQLSHALLANSSTSSCPIL